MSSEAPLPPTPAAAPTLLEKAESAVPAALEEINEKIVNIRTKACNRKSLLVSESKWIQKAKLQAKRLSRKEPATTTTNSGESDESAAKNNDASAQDSQPTDPVAASFTSSKVGNSANLAPESDGKKKESIHVSFESPLVTQLNDHEKQLLVNINAIFERNLSQAHVDIKEEISSWFALMEQEVQLHH